MANYPPTPSFGGPFASQWPPPPVPYPTYQGETLPGPPPLHPPSNRPYIPATQPDSTPQIPGLGGNSTVPLPPPAQFPPHYHNPNFPPPPFPYFSGPPPQEEINAPPHQQESRSNGYNEESSIHPSGVETQVARGFQGLSTFNSHGPPSHLMETRPREEGELSDGELDGEQSSSMDTSLARHQKERGRGSSLSNKRHHPDESYDGINREGSVRQTAHFSDFTHGGEDAPMGSNLGDSRAKVGLANGNGSIPDYSANMGRNVRNFSRNSVHSSTMENSTIAQNFEGDPAPSGPHLPGLRAPPTNHNNSGMVTGAEEPSMRSSDAKSPTQLRIMAQGALLGLAPHNVRYHELVNEGIEPNVLRRLYEEVGIKIPSGPEDVVAPAQRISPAATAESTEEENYTPPEPPAKIVEHQHNLSSHPISSPEYVPTTNELALEADTPQGKPQNEAQPKTSDSATTEPPASASDKPLERKDVIARMFAARAKKPVPDQVVSEKEQTDFQPDSQTEEQNGITPSHPAISNEVPEAHSKQSTEALVKEKNKAQTELARQRMEQLKKQGLAKSNRCDNTDSASISPPPQPQKTDHSASDHPISESSTRTLQESMHYPLPDRPPAPDLGSQSRIPGLFMTSSDQFVAESKESSPSKTHTQTSPVSRPASKTQVLPRKRPVASDFTDEPASAAKKPFYDKGTVPENKVVIDISEDEYMYDAGEDRMDVDQESDKKENPPRLKDYGNSKQSQGHPSVEVLSKTPPKTSSRQDTRPTPISRTSGKGKDQEHLRQKQLEIDAMRKRIAEFEKRHKAKQITSRTESPDAQSCQVASLPETPPVSQDKLLSAENNGAEPPTAEPPNVKSQQPEVGVQPSLNLSTDKPAKLDSSINSPTQTRASLDPANLDEMRQKFLRKKEIESGLPLLEAELLKYEQRLVEFRKEEQKILAEITKGKEGKRQLIAELESLGIETEGLSMEELQATKDNLAENIDNRPDPSAPVQSSPNFTPDSEHSNIEKDAISQAKGPHGPSQAPLRDDNMARGPMSGTMSSISQGVQNEAGEFNVSAEGADDLEMSSGSSMDESTSSAQSVSGGAPIVTNLPVWNGDSNSMSSDGPDFNNHPNVSMPSDNHSVPPSDNSQSLSGISESAERISKLPIQRRSPNVSREGSVDSDAYEPPEPGSTENFETVSSPSFSPASPRSVEAESATVPSFSGTQNDEPLTEKLQEPNEEPKVLSETTENNTQLGTSRHFSQYVSPLKQFNAYRYHPSYVDDVHEGYRSLTYSHDIDPNKYLCLFEASGGVCKDDSCIYQHFRDMHLSDDKILVQMGSLREGNTPQEKEEYIAGLKKIISDMRRDKVKDFNTVATEIAAYRRRFLEDPSRILPL